MREQLRAQSAAQIAAASRQIVERLESAQCEWGSVTLFLAQPREPNLDEFARALLKKGTRVFAPHAHEDATCFCEIAPDWSNIAMGARGWRTPREYSRPESCGPFETEKISAIFLPGLAFDLAGNRLGQGGGWYDRALAALAPGVLRVGVCFDFQIVERIPHEAHDQRVEWIVTEQRAVPIEC